MELQQWQQEILDNHPKNGGFIMRLEEKQREMIEEVLYPSDSNPYNMDAGMKAFLLKVLMEGEYHEEDREFLNSIRESYLNGKHEI